MLGITFACNRGTTGSDILVGVVIAPHPRAIVIVKLHAQSEVHRCAASAPSIAVAVAITIAVVVAAFTSFRTNAISNPIDAIIVGYGTQLSVHWVVVDGVGRRCSKCGQRLAAGRGPPYTGWSEAKPERRARRQPSRRRCSA